MPRVNFLSPNVGRVLLFLCLVLSLFFASVYCVVLWDECVKVRSLVFTKFEFKRNEKDLAKFSLAIPPQLIRLCQTVSFVFLEKQIDLLPAGYKFLS